MSALSIARTTHTCCIDDIVSRFHTDFDEMIITSFYHCTDAQFSTVAVLDGTAHLHERVYYDAYGKARACPPASRIALRAPRKFCSEMID